MNTLTLVIGNKNYSSWSLRPWLAMKQMGIEFAEISISLYTPTAHEEILKYSPSGKVPILIDGEITVWDSLAICEYLSEKFPTLAWLPEDRIPRAVARSICAEMHSGFGNLRSYFPMNCRAKIGDRPMTPEVESDVRRIVNIWCNCRQKFGSEGELLFGKFRLADAMFAPVVSRFHTYGVTLDPICQTYCEAILALPAMQEWMTAAQNEVDIIKQYEF
ncbi:glutathione S-transferase family protein [Merismopedia glauca]|uniref:Glutathione S-transferase n=1 Tax=Merismopedia glauca CCAP 1448/3 TaxID=1296344 RepID=A0A2T1C3R5_9CYAN|nr:glutathione S-transferase family protein [Merismopedia glauca]PSB02920.1 glutathione S-transferase [Merismopedia glauca CCAP 1448/3]